MLVGESRSTGPTAQAIIARVMTDEPAPPSRQRRSIPPALEAAVLRALEKLPADRWSSAQAYADAMTAPSTAARPAAARDRRAAPWGWVTAAAASALAAWGWLRSTPSAPTLPPSQLSIMAPGARAAGSRRPGGIPPDGEPG